MSGINVGDSVRVVCILDIDTANYERYIGKVGTVYSIYKNSRYPLRIHFDFEMNELTTSFKYEEVQLINHINTLMKTE